MKQGVHEVCTDSDRSSYVKCIMDVVSQTWSSRDNTIIIMLVHTASTCLSRIDPHPLYTHTHTHTYYEQLAIPLWSIIPGCVWQYWTSLL